MGLFDSIKNVARKVVDFGNRAKKIIGSGYNFIRKIPVVGNFVDTLASQNLPLVGMSAKDIAGYLDKGLGIANDVNNGLQRIGVPETPDMRSQQRPLPMRPY
jgi:hypothetical protein